MTAMRGRRNLRALRGRAVMMTTAAPRRAVVTPSPAMRMPTQKGSAAARPLIIHQVVILILVPTHPPKITQSRRGHPKNL